VFVSSHLISEMALVAEHLVVIGRGRLLADTSVAELTARRGSLEEAFFELTGESAEYRGSGPDGYRGAPPPMPPNRPLLLAAKAAVFGTVALAVGEAAGRSRGDRLSPDLDRRELAGRGQADGRGPGPPPVAVGRARHALPLRSASADGCWPGGTPERDDDRMRTA